MFSAVYIFQGSSFLTRTIQEGQFFGDASDLINSLFVPVLGIVQYEWVWKIDIILMSNSQLSLRRVKQLYMKFLGDFSFISFPRFEKSDFLSSPNLWCNQTQACVNLIKHIIQSDFFLVIFTHEMHTLLCLVLHSINFYDLFLLPLFALHTRRARHRGENLNANKNLSFWFFSHCI